MSQLQAKKIDTDALCEFGCGNKAEYITKSGHYICQDYSSKCPVIKTKNSVGNKKSHSENPEKYKSNGKLYGICSKEWKEKNPQKTIDSAKKAGKTLSTNIKAGITKPSFLGKHHTKETKQRLSQSSGKNCNNGFVKTKFYYIFNKWQNKNLTVQGTWEFKYAQYLNENNIKWNRSRNITIRYKNNENDYLRTYYPDFFLEESNTYIEVKGYFSENDIQKMENVIKCNKNKTIKILQKQDLIDLGIDLKCYIDNNYCYNKKKLHEQKLTDKESEKRLKEEKTNKCKQDKKLLKEQKRFKEIKLKVDLIINSDIDFTKFGWLTKLAKLLDLSSQYTARFMKKYMNDFYKNCYKTN